MKKPVLLISFNRLDYVQKVFEQIRKAKPPRLYLASDGPREDKEGEKENVEAVRNWLLNNIDWECEVKTRFLETNSGGCAYGVSGAVTWFFNNEEDGIILEDDCLPSLSFFKYCEELLDKYKDEKKVWHITGYGYYKDDKAKETYYFSKIQHCWGWANWADRWKYYNLDLDGYNENDINKLSNKLEVRSYLKRIFNILKNSKHKDSWDWQWSFIIGAHNGYCINPYKNLVSNIGTTGGEHYNGEEDPTHSLNTKTFEIEKIIHPKKIKYNWKAINYIYKYHYVIQKTPFLKKLIQSIFSIKNEYSNNSKRKIITIFGIKIKFKI